MIKFIPKILQRLQVNLKLSNFRKKSTNEIFTEIYNRNHWQSDESISGKGSELLQTKSLINGLDNLIKEFNIASITDLPCGDFNWMQKVDLCKIDYFGADIVQELIENNIRKFKDVRNLKFAVLNLITDPIPKSDIIICRDCLVHLSYEDIFKAIENVKSSGIRYILTTTFTNRQQNYDILTGDWRPLNLQLAPFNFPSPILCINENCTEGNGRFKDKSMALYEVSKL